MGFIYNNISTGGSSMKYADLNSQVDGSNVVFSVPETYESGKLFVWFNGVMQTRGDTYTETTSQTFTLTFTPATGENVIILYSPS
jgi:hypothetical protein|tara:strand:- start:25 stop:279 length:255 start_codon:yes stop_codon:yes gene_type:complete